MAVLCKKGQELSHTLIDQFRSFCGPTRRHFSTEAVVPKDQAF